MATRDLLVEIGLEEMPARFIHSSIEQFKTKVMDWLTEQQIDFGEVHSFSTPRRLAVLISDVNEKQKDVHEEVKGPAKKIALDDKGEWTKAAIGFTRGQKMTVDDIFFKDINGTEYVFVKKFIEGEWTKNLLPQLEKVITSLSFPINMHWGNLDMKYIRPIKWIVALFGEEVIPFSVANVQTGNVTDGHRFLGKQVKIDSPKEYEKTIENQFVIANSEKRKEIILNQIREIEKEKNWTIPIDDDLLEEVNNLVEYPTVLYGQFEKEYLSLPEEVLITTMREHQRYFPVKSKEGELLPYFVAVRNGNKDNIETVVRGNEKVLRARLADADFFYKEDQKMEIEAALGKLDKIVYHEEIGTLAEKVNRVRQLTRELASQLNFSEQEKEKADRAAEICKFDLVTNMVNEFPELQGYMGEKYALQKGEDALVAKAINEHYMPRNAGDTPAKTNVGAALAIAEKLDTITSNFAIGQIPTGSQDPYALRRQATGIVHTLIDKNWNIPLEDLIDQSIVNVEKDEFAKLSNNEIKKELISFFKLRIKYLLQERKIRYDLIDCVLENTIGSIPSLIRKAEILQQKKDEAGFKEGIEALSRVMNIATKGESLKGEVQPELFENDYEHRLYDKFLTVKNELEHIKNEEEYFERLFSLKNEINDYFDHTMIMVEDEKIRTNRLNFMNEITAFIQRFGALNKVLVK